MGTLGGLAGLWGGKGNGSGGHPSKGDIQMVNELMRIRPVSASSCPRAARPLGCECW